MSSIDLAFLDIIALHELCHAFAAKLLRVKIIQVTMKENINFIRVEYDENLSGRLKVLLIQLSPWLFDLFFGLRYLKGPFRIVWLKLWFKSKRHFAEFLLSEFQD